MTKHYRFSRVLLYRHETAHFRAMRLSALNVLIDALELITRIMLCWSLQYAYDPCIDQFVLDTAAEHAQREIFSIAGTCNCSLLLVASCQQKPCSAPSDRTAHQFLPTSKACRWGKVGFAVAKLGYFKKIKVASAGPL